MRDGSRQLPQRHQRAREVPQPRFAALVGERDARGGLEGAGGGEAAVFLALVEDGEEEGGHGREAGLLLEDWGERGPRGCLLVL